jgi:hypothetical protein
MVGVNGDADEPLSCDVGRGLGATALYKRIGNEFVLSRTGKMRKRKKAV